MFEFAHKYASLMHFHRLSLRLAPWLGWLAIILFAIGLYGGLVQAPTDYQQGESFRIIYIHVPSAWMSLFVYMTMAGAAFSVLVWRVKVAEISLRAAAPLGASFTFLALVTGAIWGKPMWGTFWVWDARLTSELVLFFIYLGVIALTHAIDDRRVAARAASVLTLIGVVNVPIIHYSVKWWNTLHQGPIFTGMAKPSVHIDMLIPLLVMVAAFMCYFGSVLLVRMRLLILEYDRNSQWLKQYLRELEPTTQANV